MVDGVSDRAMQARQEHRVETVGCCDRLDVCYFLLDAQLVELIGVPPLQKGLHHRGMQAQMGGGEAGSTNDSVDTARLGFG